MVQSTTQQAIFQPEAYQQPNLLQRLMGRQPRRNALVALKELLNQRPVRQVTAEDINAIREQYGHSPVDTFPEEAAQIFQDYLHACLADKHLSDDEVADLQHLKHLLALSERQTRAIQERVSKQVFKRAMDEAVADGLLTDEEERFLEHLRDQLWLPEETWQALHQQSVRERMDQLMDAITEDGRISPEEEAELNRVANSLNVDMRMDEATRRVYDRMKLFWQIENADTLPTIEPSYNLQKNERAYFQAQGDWYETRTRTQRVDYGGPSARLRIAKGIYYNAGSMNVQRVRREELKHIETGEMLVTNKRFLFIGAERSKQIRLNKILTIEPFADGVQIKKSAGRSPYIMTPSDEEAQLLAMFLNRLLQDA